MKKLLFILILMLSPMMANADAIEIGGIYYNLNLVEKTAEVTYGNWDPITIIDGDGRYSGEIEIPESVDYDGMSYSITSIGYYAFDYCENLNAVTIPSSVTSIGNYAFAYCNLSSLSIPSSVTSIGDDAFRGCSSLSSLSIPSSVISIGSYAFEGCSGLTTFIIPDGLTFISESVFNGCTSLASVTIPDGVTSIGNYAFQNCSSLTSISIPSSVTSIGNYAFYRCNLSSLNIPNSVTSIGDYAFQGCSSLTSLSIPSSVTSIGILPFYGCIGLTSIKVEEGNIAYDSRNNSNAIIKTDENKLITGCNNTVIPDDVTSIAVGAFSGCYDLTSVTIPNGVTSIGNNAFEGCTGLTSITIPSSVTSIGEYATFSGCTELTSIIVEEGNPVYDSRDNCNAIIKTANNELMYACNNTVIPNSVTSIGDLAFWGCSGLTSITIPNGVTSIGRHTFMNCGSLISITIPNGVTSIECGSFQNCSGLTSMTIPDNVTSIPELSFNGCSSLTSLTIGKSVTSIGYNAFSGCWSLKDLYCYAEKVPEVESTAFENCNIEEVTLYLPAASVSTYQAVEPWKNFKEIVALPFKDDDNSRKMLVEGKTWNVVSIHPADPPKTNSEPGYYKDIKGHWGTGTPHTYELKGDTVMGGVTYKKLFLDGKFVSGLREEDGRIYECYWDNVPEELTFDFGLQPGDIIKDAVNGAGQMQVKQVTEVNIDGKSRRCLEMWAYEEGEGIIDGLVDYWIEGVGCMNGPHFPFWWGSSTQSLLLSCYEDGECIFTIEDFYKAYRAPSDGKVTVGDVSDTGCLDKTTRSESVVGRPTLKLTRFENGLYGEWNNIAVNCAYGNISVACEESGQDLSINLLDDSADDGELATCICHINVYFTVYNALQEEYHLTLAGRDIGTVSFKEHSVVEIDLETLEQAYEDGFDYPVKIGYIGSPYEITDNIKPDTDLSQSLNIYNLGDQCMHCTYKNYVLPCEYTSLDVQAQLDQDGALVINILTDGIPGQGCKRVAHLSFDVINVVKDSYLLRLNHTIRFKDENGQERTCTVCLYEGEYINTDEDISIPITDDNDYRALLYHSDGNADLNGDGKVNGTDIQAVINVIVDEEYSEKADVNKDNKVNGTDIQEIINIIVNE